MNELDHILLDQLHSARKRRRLVLGIKKLLKNDSELIRLEVQNEKSILYFETQIKDKKLLKKRRKIKKLDKNIDILAKNPVYDWYKTVFMASAFGYKMFMDSLFRYMSYFKKGKN